MLNKRGQVTIFIIIAVLIVAAVGVYFAFKENLTDVGEKATINEPLSSEYIVVEKYIGSCLEQTSEEGIYFIGLQGGYFYMPENFVDISLYSVPIHFYEGDFNFPEIAFIENELNTYIEQNIKNCINFTDFENEGIKVTERGEIKIESSFNEEDILIELFYPLSINKGGTTTLLEESRSSINFDFYYVYDILENLKSEQEKNPNYFPIGAFSDLAYQNNLSYEIIYLPENIVIYSISFNDPKKFKEPYIFSLGAKYDW